MSLIGKASARFYLRHPWQLALAVAGVALGVGVFVGISLANDSAARAFEVAAERVRGPFTHRVLAVDGALDERLYRELVLGAAAELAAPVLEGELTRADARGQGLRVVGIDPMKSARGARANVGLTSANDVVTRLIAEPDTVLLPRSLRREAGVGDGTTLTVIVGGRERLVSVLGEAPEAAGDGEPALLADIATAQELLGRIGQLDRIDLRLTAAQARALSLPAGTVLLPVEGERSTFAQLTAAFRTNLTALGLLALVVGTFLIYGTMSFAVLQRATTLGILRAIGVTRGEIVRAVLREAVAIGSLATAAGLAIGHVLALGLVGLVLRTIGDLSFGSAVSGAAASPWIYVQGAALGLGATIVAAVKPALDGARMAPAAALRRSTLERGARGGARGAALLALGMLGLAASLLAIDSSSVTLGFAALGAVLAAGALVTPLATVAFTRLVEATLGARLGLAAGLASRGVRASLSRTGVAAAALTVAVATVNGVGLMISSFRLSLDRWLDTTLTADVYVGGGESGALDGLVDSGALARLAGVEALGETRTRSVPTPEHGPITVRGMHAGSRGYGLTVVDGDAGALDAVATGAGVVASERLLLARGLEVGDALELATAGGTVRMPIVAAFQDFNTGEPAIVMSLERYEELWGKRGALSVGLELRDGANADAVAAAVRALELPSGGLRVRATAGLKTLSLAIFDRTFRVTEVLRILAGIVAFLGVLSALLAVELERARELAVLRTLGFTPQGLAATLLAQTGLLGFAAGVAAMPLGVGLAAVLVHVINRRSFGWSMDFAPEPQALLAGLALAVGAALLAGAYPAWRASRIELGAALREE